MLRKAQLLHRAHVKRNIGNSDDKDVISNIFSTSFGNLTTQASPDAHVAMLNGIFRQKFLGKSELTASCRFGLVEVTGSKAACRSARPA